MERMTNLTKTSFELKLQFKIQTEIFFDCKFFDIWVSSTTDFQKFLFCKFVF